MEGGKRRVWFYHLSTREKKLASNVPRDFNPAGGSQPISQPSGSLPLSAARGPAVRAAIA
jgi:hypothetical protein